MAVDLRNLHRGSTVLWENWNCILEISIKTAAKSPSDMAKISGGAGRAGPNTKLQYKTVGCMRRSRGGVGGGRPVSLLGTTIYT